MCRLLQLQVGSLHFMAADAECLGAGGVERGVECEYTDDAQYQARGHQGQNGM
jgi:hypothetical protein